MMVETHYVRVKFIDGRLSCLASHSPLWGSRSSYSEKNARRLLAATQRHWKKLDIHPGAVFTVKEN